MDERIGRPLSAPTSYEGWINRLDMSSSTESIFEAAANAAKFNPDKKQARHDVAMILYRKHKIEASRAGDNDMVIRTVKRKFEHLSKLLFNGSLASLIDYAEKHIKAEEDALRQRSQ